MRKILLSLLTIGMLYSCQKEDVTIQEVETNIEVASDWHLADAPIPDDLNGYSSREELPEILNEAIQTGVWDGPWELQRQVKGYGLHYGNNPIGLDASTDRDNWLRGRYWIFQNPHTGKKFAIMKRVTYQANYGGVLRTFDTIQTRWVWIISDNRWCKNEPIASWDPFENRCLLRAGALARVDLERAIEYFRDSECDNMGDHVCNPSSWN